MSDNNALTELADYAAKSPLASDDPAVRRHTVNSIGRTYELRPARRKVSDLLSAVMVLSARSRRRTQPRVTIELDVFAPTNGRAATLKMGLADCSHVADR